LNRSAGPEVLQGRADIDIKAGSHPASLGDHENSFRQAAAIPILQGLELLEAHVEPGRNLANAEALVLATTAEGFAQGSKSGGSSGVIGRRGWQWDLGGGRALPF